MIEIQDVKRSSINDLGFPEQTRDALAEIVRQSPLCPTHARPFPIQLFFMPWEKDKLREYLDSVNGRVRVEDVLICQNEWLKEPPQRRAEKGYRKKWGEAFDELLAKLGDLGFKKDLESLLHVRDILWV